MRVFVTGASGLLGTSLVARLRARGDEVVALSRKPAKGTDVEWVAGDLVAGGSWQDQVGGAQAVVHLAGEPLAERRWTTTQKDRIRRSRVEGTRRVVEAMGRGSPPPRVLVAASAVGIYGQRGEEPLDEAAGPGSGFLAELCQAWEAETERAREGGARTVSLRFGVITSARGGALPRMLPAFKMFAGGPLGDPEAWFPWVHEEDAVGLVLHAIDTAAVAGAMNAVAPGIVRMRAFAEAIGRAIGRPARLPVPQFALRALLGELATAVNPGLRVLPRAALATGYRFAYEQLEPALASLLNAPTP